MWAGCGLAAQDFFPKKYTRLDGSYALPHVLCERHHAACDYCQRTAERQLAEAGKAAISLVGTDLLRCSRSDADALYLLCFDRRRQCGSGNGHPIYLSGDGDPLGLLSKKTAAAGRGARGRRTGDHRSPPSGDGRRCERLSVPADCVYLGLASAVFFAICCVFPKRFIGVLDNSFVLALGMFTGAVASYIINPMGTFPASLLRKSASIFSGSSSLVRRYLLPATMQVFGSFRPHRLPSLRPSNRRSLSLRLISSFIPISILSKALASCLFSLLLQRRVFLKMKRRQENDQLGVQIGAFRV